MDAELDLGLAVLACLGLLEQLAAQRFQVVAQAVQFFLDDLDPLVGVANARFGLRQSCGGLRRVRVQHGHGFAKSLGRFPGVAILGAYPAGQQQAAQRALRFFLVELRRALQREKGRVSGGVAEVVEVPVQPLQQRGKLRPDGGQQGLAVFVLPVFVAGGGGEGLFIGQDKGQQAVARAGKEQVAHVGQGALHTQRVQPGVGGIDDVGGGRVAFGLVGGGRGCVGAVLGGALFVLGLVHGGVFGAQKIVPEHDRVRGALLRNALCPAPVVPILHPGASPRVAQASGQFRQVGPQPAAVARVAGLAGGDGVLPVGGKLVDALGRAAQGSGAPVPGKVDVDGRRVEGRLAVADRNAGVVHFACVRVPGVAAFAIGAVKAPARILPAPARGQQPAVAVVGRGYAGGEYVETAGVSAMGAILAGGCALGVRRLVGGPTQRRDIDGGGAVRPDEFPGMDGHIRLGHAQFAVHFQPVAIYGYGPSGVARIGRVQLLRGAVDVQRFPKVVGVALGKHHVHSGDGVPGRTIGIPVLSDVEVQ